LKEKFFLTTAIPYVNAAPHLGTSYEMIGTDILARYMRLSGKDVLFLTGTDENSLNAERKARSLGEEPQSYCDRMVEKIRAIWKALNISYDDFIRTTEDRHKRAAQEFFRRVHNNGDIYKKLYEGWYCVSCEAFYVESDLVAGKCPNHGVKPDWIKEENYFFALSKYQDKLLEHIERNPNFIQPEVRKNEVVSFINQGLRDFSISRASIKWGIPTPIDPNQVIYVWFDALINYISGIGFPDNLELFERYWPAELHIIGKDIIRFHCVYWPAMLMSAGLPLPKMVFGHGWILIKGERMSKSRGLYVDPEAAVKEYEADPIRYHLIREVPFGKDGDFSWESFVERYNADLANDLGNLLNRTLAMVNRYCQGKIPPLGKLEGFDIELKDLALSLLNKVDEKMKQLAFHEALEVIWQLIRRANKYIDQSEPWKLAKEKNLERLNTVLYNCLETLRFVAILLTPFIPESTDKIKIQMGLSQELNAQTLSDLREWGKIPSGVTLGKAEPIFPRLEIEKGEKGEKEKLSEKEQPKSEFEAQIDLEYFKKMDLRVAEVLSAEKVPGKDRLLILQIDLGSEKRQIVAGVAQHYKPEALIGKKILVVVNLKPAKIAGIESNGMLLAASSANALVIATFEADIPPGTKVK
jgi:methionyl-tRNA synthetase